MNSTVLQNGYLSAPGAGIYVDGKLTMNNGSIIQNCETNSGAGVAVALGTDSEMTMNGGEIKNCTTNYFGVISSYWWTGAKFTMNGGSIHDNNANYGGAIDGRGSSGAAGMTIILNDGSIYNNTCQSTYGGAVRLDATSMLSVSGGIEIYNNGGASDIICANADKISVAGRLTTNKWIGYNSATNDEVIANGVSGYKLSASDLSKFRNTADRKIFELKGNSIITVDGYEIDFNANSGTGYMGFMQVKDSSSQALTTNTFKNNGYTFVGWNTAEDGTGIAYTDKEAVTLETDTTLYAQWKVRELDSIEITSEPKTSYSVGQTFDPAGMVVKAVYDNGEEETVDSYTYESSGKLTVDDEAVTVTYNGKSVEIPITVKDDSDGGTPVYDTSNATDPDNFENGTVEANFSNPSAGVLVTLTITPDKGYEVGEVTITDENGKKIEVIDNGDGTYSYRQPASEIEIDVEFNEIGEKEDKEENPEVKDEPKTEITLTIGFLNATVNGETIINDVAPVIRNGRTMLPIRFIADALGAKVEWDDEAKKVTIT